MTDASKKACRCIGKPCRRRRCVTIERWAAACRAAHWFDDDTLAPWSGYIRRHGNDAPLWRRVALAAIAELNRP